LICLITVEWSSRNTNPKLPAKDLTKEYPRSPRETLAGYLIAARTLDKCRAVLAGTAGEYHFNFLNQKDAV